MSRPTYVYGWNFDGRQRAIVLTRSRAAIRRALAQLGHHASDSWLRDYGSETGNVDELAAAHAAGEDVILVAGNDSTEFTPLQPRRGAR